MLGMRWVGIACSYIVLSSSVSEVKAIYKSRKYIIAGNGKRRN
jgi:hypothetical protein